MAVFSSFHNKLKTNPRYLNHKVNRRCDDLIETLLLVEVDMYYERKRRQVFTKLPSVSEDDRYARGNSITSSEIHAKVLLYTYM